MKKRRRTQADRKAQRLLCRLGLRDWEGNSTGFRLTTPAEAYLDAYIEGAGIAEDTGTLLICTLAGRTRRPAYGEATSTRCRIEGSRLTEFVETAATRYARIASPETLARVLDRLARRAKADLPDRFMQNVQGLLDDFAEAIGIQFTDEEGEEFLGSSPVQIAFYALFAAWTLWNHSSSEEEFRWQNLGDVLKTPADNCCFGDSTPLWVESWMSTLRTLIRASKQLPIRSGLELESRGNAGAPRFLLRGSKRSPEGVVSAIRFAHATDMTLQQSLFRQAWRGR